MRVFGPHPRRAFRGLYHCAKFGWNRCSIFDKCMFFDFTSLAWKCLFRPQNWGFGETVTKPVHRLQIRAIVHNYGVVPTTHPSYIWVRAVVWTCGRGQTDTQTRVTTTHFASSTTHAKCNKLLLPIVIYFHRVTKATRDLWYRPRLKCCGNLSGAQSIGLFHSKNTQDWKIA